MRHAVSIFLLILLAAVAALVPATPLAAATFDMPTDAQLLERADVVVVATVLDASSRATADRMVYTDSRLQVDEVLKGKADPLVLVRELGGFADGIGVLVNGAPSYIPGTRVLAFLRKQSDGTYFTAYMALGKFSFRKAQNGRELYMRDAENLDVHDGEEAFAARPAQAFVDSIRAGAPQKAPRLFDVETNVRPTTPTTNAAASTYVVRGSAPALNLPIRWEGCEKSSPLCPTINFTTNGPQNGTADTPTAIDNAFDAWEDDPNSFVRLNLSGLNGDTGADNDGVNDLIFNGTGTLGFCDGSTACSVIFFGETHTYESETWYSVESSDVVMKPLTYNSQSALDAVLSHEVGHSLALKHGPSGSIMAYPTPTNNGAALRNYDKEAMAEVYGAGLPCQNVAISGTSGGGNVQSGNTKQLSVTATGTTPFTYQWYEGTSGNTANPVGSNSANFTTPPVTVQKQYWVRVSNTCPSSADSQTITVTPQACDKPTFVTQPQSVRINPNATATLTVAATGETPMAYKWYRGALNDTTNQVGSAQSYTTPPLTQTTTYWARATNECGTTDSALATVTVGTQCVPPTITGQPTNVNVQLGEGATLNVTAAGDAPFTYQWYLGEADNESQPIGGATASAYPAGPFNTAGTFRYWVKVTNECGTAKSLTVIVSIACPDATTPKIKAPAAAHFSMTYDVEWTGDLGTTPTFELQEATNPEFTQNLTIHNVAGAKKKTIPAHNNITTDTRYYYRVRAINGCNQQITGFSATTSTVVTRPLPSDSSSFSISVPDGTSQTFTQDLLVPGFGETATNADTFTVTSDVPWILPFPASGALSAGGTTIQLTISPATLDVGTTTGTVLISRTQPSLGKNVRTNGTTTVTLPFSLSLVTPVTPTPRSGSAPPGTMIIPAVAHADGIGTRFQSDVRIVNTSNAEIEYEVSFTTTGQNGTQTGKQTNLTIGANDVKALDDIVKAWYGAGVLNEFGIGTIEIRPLNAVDPLATFASSRTYAVETTGTYGQFIPAIRIEDFIGNVNTDSLAKISLQQVANSATYRSNIGLVEGSGTGATVLVRLFDGNNTLLQTVTRSLQPFGHEQLAFSQLFGNTMVDNGRIEVSVTSEGGKATAYASVIDNATSDPLLVFPEQALRSQSQHYVVPGVAELENGVASNFHSDMRVYNAGDAPVTITLNYYPQAGDATPRPVAVQRTIDPGKVTAIDNVLPSLWNLSRTGGAVTIDASAAAPLVVTARTYSRDAENGTYGQFIPGVTAKDAVGSGERALEVLQLEQSDQYRTNLGLVEVTGQSARVEITAYKPDSKISAVTATTLEPNQFIQFGRIFSSMGLPTTYNGRISVKVLEGNGRVAAYGSVVDNRTVDPTYVPAQ